MNYALPFVLAAFAIMVLVRLALWTMPKPGRKTDYGRADYGRDDSLDDVQPTKSTKPNITFEKIKRDEVNQAGFMRAPSRFGKRTVPPTRKPTIQLTPRMLERVNTQRKLRGRSPLSRTGIKAAVATASVEQQTYGNRQPSTNDQWLTYLILYQCFLSDHHSHTVGGVGGLIIDPNVPLNGMEMGGTFGGAGASGDWTSAPQGVTDAASLAVGDYSGAKDYASGGFVRGDDVPTVVHDPAPSYTPDPTPSYSAPDPSPSYSAPDTSSSYSSSDTGSSPSGGGDGS